MDFFNENALVKIQSNQSYYLYSYEDRKFQLYPLHKLGVVFNIKAGYLPELCFYLQAG